MKELRNLWLHWRELCFDICSFLDFYHKIYFIDKVISAEEICIFEQIVQVH